ncbi:MAG: HNH endonuclease [Acidobacteriia bacterium]|nr:HNH endonuclease [Terriglobia bacterium]
MTNSETRDLVRRRAGSRCEYCLLRQEHTHFTHHVEHIVAKQHGGSEEPANLALACHRCNLRKGPNLTGIDPLTNQVVALFHPRRDQWHDHFRVREVRIEGTTPIGRATVNALAMNDARRLDLRQELLLRGDLP